jgi:hypothetical protein
MEKRRKTLHDEYKKRSSRAEEERSIGLVEYVVECVELGACRNL